ncbi:unnamed protein product [[Candida] boidinii]|nr:unnamed protein product [[Candida] boidinii]
MGITNSFSSSLCFSLFEFSSSSDPDKSPSLSIDNGVSARLGISESGNDAALAPDPSIVVVMPLAFNLITGFDATGASTLTETSPSVAVESILLFICVSVCVPVCGSPLVVSISPAISPAVVFVYS